MRQWIFACRLGAKRVVSRPGLTILVVSGIVLTEVLVLWCTINAIAAGNDAERLRANRHHGLADAEISRTAKNAFALQDLEAIQRWPNVAQVFWGRSKRFPKDKGSITVYQIDPLVAMRFAVYVIDQGQLLKADGSWSIIVDRTYAKVHGLKLGDVIEIPGKQGSQSFHLVGIASDYGLAAEAKLNHGIALIVEQPSAIESNLNFLWLKFEDAGKMDATVDSLTARFGGRYYVNPLEHASLSAGLSELSSWIQRAISVAGALLASVVLLLPGGLAIRQGMKDENLSRLWACEGLSAEFLNALFMAEAACEAIAATLVLFLFWFLLEVVWHVWKPIGDVSVGGSLWLFFAALTVVCWLCLVIGRMSGAAWISQRRGKVGRTVFSAWRIIALFVGVVMLLGSWLVVNNAGVRISIDHALWCFCGLFIVSVPLIAASIAAYVASLAVHVVSLFQHVMRFRSLNITRTLILDGTVTIAGVFSVAAVVSTAVLILDSSLAVVLEVESSYSRKTYLLSMGSANVDESTLYKTLDRIGGVEKYSPLSLGRVVFHGQPVSVAGIPFEELIRLMMDAGGNDWHRLTRRDFERGCLLSAAWAVEHSIEVGKELELEYPNGKLALTVLGTLPVMQGWANVVAMPCSLQILGFNKPAHYILTITSASDSYIVLQKLSEQIPEATGFRLRPFQEADAAVTMILRSMRQWLALAFIGALVMGVFSACCNCTLQMALSRGIRLMRELGASDMMVIREVFTTVSLLVGFGLVLGGCLGMLESYVVHCGFLRPFLLGVEFRPQIRMVFLLIPSAVVLVAGIVSSILALLLKTGLVTYKTGRNLRRPGH